MFEPRRANLVALTGLTFTGLYTIIDRRAFAVGECFEQFAHLAQARELRVDLGDLVGGERTPARAGRGLRIKSVEQALDFVEAKAGGLRELDNVDARDGGVVISALIADARRGFHKAGGFVIAQRGGGYAGFLGKLADGQHFLLDLKSTLSLILLS